jgi:hypothetical protein
LGEDLQRAGVGQCAADRQGRAAGAGEAEIDESVIDERAGRRQRGAVVEREGASDLGEPSQCAVRPQRRAVFDKRAAGEAQRRARRDRADLPARELDRTVAEEFNFAAQGPGGAESRAAGHVEERYRLAAMQAVETDLTRINERRRRHHGRRREPGTVDGEKAAVG